MIWQPGLVRGSVLLVEPGQGLGETGDRRLAAERPQAANLGRTVEETEEPQDRELARALVAPAIGRMSSQVTVSTATVLPAVVTNSTSKASPPE